MLVVGVTLAEVEVETTEGAKPEIEEEAVVLGAGWTLLLVEGTVLKAC